MLTFSPSLRQLSSTEKGVESGCRSSSCASFSTSNELLSSTSDPLFVTISSISWS